MNAKERIMDSGDLKIGISEDESLISISWSGRSTERDPGKFLNPVLGEAFKTADTEGKSVLLDFKNLEYMNSSTVTPVVKILSDAGKGIKSILIKYNNKFRWQQVSFSALQVFAAKDTRISIVGE